MLDIQDWVYRNFHYVREYGDTTDLRVDCPFCEHRVGKIDEKQKLHICLDKHVCHCFRCDYGRSWLGLVMDVMGVDMVTAVGELYTVPKARYFESIPDEFEHVPEAQTVYARVQDFQFPPGYVELSQDPPSGRDLQSIVKRYLLKRGFDEQYWAAYYLGVSKEYAWRVIIPIEGAFWQARAVFPFLLPKYVSPSSESRRVLFNAGALHISEEVVVCEGAFSAMSVGNNAIALVGKTLTSEKVSRLIKSTVDRFSIALDSDASSVAMELAGKLYRGGKEVEVWKYTEGDPADGGAFDVVEYDLKSRVRELLS